MFSFLHRASLMERYHTGLLDRSLLLALIGITALLTDLGLGTSDYGSRCMDEAATLCLADIERPSIIRLQALVIIVKHRILSKRLSGAFMLHGVASRFATALRLNHENPALCFLAQESLRRLMWSLFMIDSGISSGRPDLALWPDPEHQIHIQLPCNERNFEFDLPETTESLRPPPSSLDSTPAPLPDALGFMALHVRMHWLRTKILQRTIKVACAPSVEDLDALPGSCAELVSELDAFEARLPLSFRWSEANLRLRTYSPRLGIFVMTHIWWRQCHLDLYRLFLPGLKEALPSSALAQLDQRFVAYNRRQCYEHARAMADMFAQLLTLSNSAPVTDIDLPGCAFQCARMLYHGLQTAGDELGFTAEGVREFALVCLRAAKQSTAGPACAGIQADIKQLIAGGLELSQNQPASLESTRLAADTSYLPYLAPSIGSSRPRVGPLSINALPVAYDPGFAQVYDGPATASLALGEPARELATSQPLDAPSRTSAGTSTSNALKEIDGLNFEPHFLGANLWTAADFSNDWPSLGRFPGAS
ncbi:hypothetical protein B0T17DRAFT_546473, partial [Bombardia bombarda]